MNFRTLFRISGSALTAQRLRLDVIANNLANVTTTRTPDGGPFQRRLVVFTSRGGVTQSYPVGRGVEVAGIVEDPTEGPRVYDPEHPHADEDGFVTLPNVDVVSEMVDMMAARRAYEANVVVINAGKAMALRALDIGR